MIFLANGASRWFPLENIHKKNKVLHFKAVAELNIYVKAIVLQSHCGFKGLLNRAVGRPVGEENELILVLTKSLYRVFRVSLHPT